MGLTSLTSDRGGKPIKRALCIAPAGKKITRAAHPFSGPSPLRLHVQVCIARRRQLLVLNVTSGGLQTVRELPVPDRARALAISGDAVCAAAGGRYLVFQVSSGRTQPLFEYDPALVRPMVRSVRKVSARTGEGGE